MKENLIIHLGEDALQPIDWLCVDDHGQVVASGQLSGASELAYLHDMSEKRAVIVLLPSAQLSIQQIPLSLMHYRKMKHSLGYLFEEQVIADPDTLHVCELSYEQGVLSAAIISHQQMSQWCQWFADCGISAMQWLPDCLALPPCADSSLVVWQTERGYLLRSGTMQGGYIDASWFACALASLDPEQQASVVTNATDHVFDRREIQRLSEGELPLEALAPQALSSNVNLLQGVYRGVSSTTKQGNRWYLAIAVMFMLVTGVANIASEQWSIRHQLAANHQQLVNDYQQIYTQKAPHRDDVLIDALQRAAMHQQSNSEHSLMDFLAQLAPLWHKFPALQLQSMHYDVPNRAVVFKVKAPSFDRFTKFKQAAHPLHVEVGSLNKQGEQVIGILTIKEQA